MSNRAFITLNQDVMTELIRKAERYVYYAAPGVYDWVAEALMEVSESLGLANVTVIVDADPFVMQVGYGTEGGLRRLHSKGIPIRMQKGLRVGILIADDFAAVFAPPALNVDVFPVAGVPNAVCLSGAEAERLRLAISAGSQEIPDSPNPEMEDERPADNVPVIPVVGETLLRKSDLVRLHETLLQHPPVSPDLDRQMRVINSTFQVVRIAFHGAKLSQRRLPLQTEELGIDDPELRRRIGASFKLFETDIDLFTRGLQEDLDEIKRQYNLKPMGEVGHLVLSRDRAGLENALRFFQANLERAQQDLEEDIRRELDYSKNRLREFFASKLQRRGDDEERFTRRLDSILRRMKFPHAKEVLSNLACEWYLFNVSEQMFDKDVFAEKVKTFYGKPIEELVQIEPVVGVKPATKESTYS
jgi:hypothetical protein